MKFSTLLLFGLSSIDFSGAVASVQFCHKDAVVDFCVAMTTAHNATTHGIDLHVTIGVDSEPGLGWMAIGAGEAMAGSLMLFLISDNKNGLALSVRTTTGHIPPQAISDGGLSADIVAATLQHKSWQEVGFVCYGCGDWPTLVLDSSSQPWIFARNAYQRFETASPYVSIQKHETYGVFYADMQASRSPGQVMTPPDLVRSRGSFGTSTSPLRSGDVSSNTDSQRQSGSATRAHGILLGLAFMVLYPAGALLFSTSYSSFRVHLAIQLTGTVGCVCGVGSQVLPLLRAGTIRPMLEAHPLFGTILTLLVVAQMWLGYCHHKRYVKTWTATPTTQAHRWNGRLLLVGGCINTVLGISYAKDTISTRLAWGILAAIEVILFLVVAPELRKRRMAGDKGEYSLAKTEDQE